MTLMVPRLIALAAVVVSFARGTDKVCTFVNEPKIPYFWDEKCVVESLGCWADGVHAQCRFCGKAPYVPIDCPPDATVPLVKECNFKNPPVTPFYWEPACVNHLLGCNADGENLECRFCGEGAYADIRCPTEEQECTWPGAEPVTPYYWDTTCQMGHLGCNADGIHIECRFCEMFPFKSVRCPPYARPEIPTYECWFPHGTAQTYYWDNNCKLGILGCLADGIHEPLIMFDVFH
eukprot:s4026_g1.t1